MADLGAIGKDAPGETPEIEIIANPAADLPPLATLIYEIGSGGNVATGTVGVPIG